MSRARGSAEERNALNRERIARCVRRLRAAGSSQNISQIARAARVSTSTASRHIEALDAWDVVSKGVQG